MWDDCEWDALDYLEGRCMDGAPEYEEEDE